MKWSLISGRFWIAVATIAVVALLFAYYFLSYIPVREDQLLSKKYRALQRIAKNFSEMRTNYSNSIGLLISQHYDEGLEDWIKNLYTKQCILDKDTAIRHQEIRDEIEAKRKTLDVELDKIKVELAAPSRMGRYRHYREGGYVYFKHYFRVKMANLITNEDVIDNNFDRLLVIRMFRVPLPSAPGHEPQDSVISVVAYQGRKFEEASGTESKILLNDISFLFDTAQVFRTTPMHRVKIAGKPFRSLSYVVEMGGQDWILCGLVSEASIRANIRKVDLFLLIMLVLVALFLLLAMPVLKLLIMSSIERLQILNVWLIGFSILTGTALVTILLLVGHHYVNYKDDYRRKLEKLSMMVATKFRSEIDDIVLQMINIGPAFPGDILDTQYDFALTGAARTKMNGDVLTYKYFNELLFINGKGKVPLVFANHMLPKASSDLPDLSKRKYFSEPKAGNVFHLRGDKLGFFVQSIRSWNSGRHEAGISIPTDLTACIALDGKDQNADSVQFEVLATATRLRSVMNPLLPPGYQFCIVDEDGEALFHSDIRKNLQENFLDEIDHNYLAEAVIAGKSSRQVEVNYSGKKCLAYIAPLTQSMFLVTLLDQEYYNTPIVLTFGGVWVLTATMMLLLGVQLILLFCFTYRSSKLQIRRFSLGWVGPRSDKQTPDFSMRYARCIAEMSMIAIVLIVFYFLGFSLILSVAFVTLPMLLLCAHYALLYDADPENNLPADRNRFVIASLLIVSTVNIAALSQVEFLVGLLLLLFQAVIVALIVSNLFTNVFARLHEWIAEHLRSDKLYSTFLYSWLLLVGIFPVCYFYQTAFVHENFLWKKFIQWEAYHARKSRSSLLSKEFAEMGYFQDDVPRDTLYLSKNDYLCVSDWFGDYRLCDIDNFDTTAIRAIDEDFIEAEEFEFRPAFVGPLEKSRSALIANPEVFKWFARSSRDALLLTDEGQIIYSSLIEPFELHKGSYAAAFGLIFILFVYALSILVRTCVRYIFGLGLLHSHATENLLELNEMSLTEVCHKVFIIGLPYSGKSELLSKIKARRIVKEIFLRTDLESSPDLSESDLFIVHNFEHALNDQVMNDKRLQLFINLQKNPNASILVTSTVQPDSILDVLEGRIKQMIQDKRTEEKDKVTLQKEINSMRNSHRIWKNILSGFEIQFQPLSVKGKPATFVERELGIGNFLPKLKKYFTDIRNIDEEEIILQIEARASAYYQSLWNSFTRKEKHALFDLAKDRFLNLRDAAKVRMLMNKGIIVMRDSPQIMNRSFNNFILSVVKEDEALAMTNELRRKGSWAGLQLVLVIMLVSVVIFIAFVQQEILTSINALVLTISSVVALLARFSGIFGGSKPKE